jgi:Endomembrane protein 70
VPLTRAKCGGRFATASLRSSFLIPIPCFCSQFWIKTMLLTAAVYPLSCFGIGFVLNTIAIFQHSLAAVPFGTMVVRHALPKCDLL